MKIFITHNLQIIKSIIISVILPFYNAKKTLAAAIESILCQTYERFELLLINNNSTDTSLSIAEKYAADDGRIKILHESQQGIVNALNTGCRSASGDFIARMDADDISFPDRLEKQVNFLNAHPDIGLIAGQAVYPEKETDTAGFKRYVTWSNSIITHEQISNRRFMESPLIHPTVMWRKKVGEQWGLYLPGDFPEDYELWLRWLEKGVKFYKLPEEILQWNDLPERLTRTHINYSDRAFFKIKTEYLVRWLKKNNPHHPNVYIWGASKISRKRVQFLQQYGIKIRAYIDIKETRQLNEQVIHFEDLPDPKAAFILVYMKHAAIRAEIQDYLQSAGYAEGKHYLLVS